MSELADILLGRKKSEARDIATNEIRWSIPLPAHPSGDGEIHIKPAMLPGELILRAGQETLKLKVGVAMPAIPNAPPEAQKVLVSSPVIEMLINPSTGAVDFAPDRLDQLLTVSEHRAVNSWTALVTSKGGVNIELKIRHKLEFSGHFSSAPSAPGGFDRWKMLQVQYFLRGMNKLLSHAGATDIRFSREEMGLQWSPISLMCHLCLLSGPHQRLSFNANTVESLVLSSEPSEILILSHITLGGAGISLAAVGTANVMGDAHVKRFEVMDLGPVRNQPLRLRDWTV